MKRPGRGVDHPHHLVPRLKKEYNYTSTPLWVFVARYGVNILPLPLPSRKGRGRAVGCPATFVYFQKTVFVLVAVRTPNFTHFLTVLADTAITSYSVASYVMQIDTVCYNRSTSNKMVSNNGSLTMTNEASYSVMKFVLRHAYAASAFTSVRAHA